MKYSIVLKSNTTPEWRGQYLNYDWFKDQLDKFDKVQACAAMETSYLTRAKTELEANFMKALKTELCKINTNRPKIRSSINIMKKLARDHLGLFVFCKFQPSRSIIGPCTGQILEGRFFKKTLHFLKKWQFFEFFSVKNYFLVKIVMKRGIKCLFD